VSKEQQEGRVYQFKIVEFKDGGKNLVVSRRVLLEEGQRNSTLADAGCVQPHP